MYTVQTVGIRLAVGEDFGVCQSPALSSCGADALALQPQICALELTSSRSGCMKASP